MDAIELLSRLGQVEPADQVVLDALTIPAGRGRRTNRRSRLLIAGAVAVAAAGVVVLPGVTGGRPSTPVSSTPRSSIQARSGVGAILTAFTASKNNILIVTKTMAGPEGTLGKTIIWIDPVGAGRGTVV
jgi:hypothetical protein